MTEATGGAEIACLGNCGKSRPKVDARYKLNLYTHEIVKWLCAECGAKPGALLGGDAEARAAAAEKRVEELTEALKPFAEFESRGGFARSIYEHANGCVKVFARHANMPNEIAVTRDNFRRAAAALAGGPK